MRVSTEPGDPGYIDWDHRHKYLVTLDGEKVLTCITADTETGMVRFCQREDDNNPASLMRDALNPDKFAIFETYGNVEIIVAE